MAFNVAPFHGKACRVEYGGTKMAYSLGWSITANLEMADQTAQGDAWKTGLPGLASWSGSFNGHFVAGNTEQKVFFDNIVSATPGVQLTTCKFLLDADTNAYIGNVYITSLAITTAIGGVVGFTVNFAGDGALSLVANA